MSGDPANPYPSAAELRRDLERYLNSQPVAARPGAFLPRLTKALRTIHSSIVLGYE